MPDLNPPTQRPWRKTGIEFPCMICGKIVYRRGSQIARGIRKTCGNPECKSASMRGANNPFWGKQHAPETIERINASKRARPQSSHGPAKGSFRHTPEARAKMSAALKERWRTNRDKMLAQFANKPKKPRELLRYRRNFTKWQRQNWTKTNCAWCDSPDNLVLDHIIPVMCGGVNEQRNAQTLCQTCNLWKMKHVDRQLFLAGLGNQGG